MYVGSTFRQKHQCNLLTINVNCAPVNAIPEQWYWEMQSFYSQKLEIPCPKNSSLVSMAQLNHLTQFFFFFFLAGV
jgi:hypothetical protein